VLVALIHHGTEERAAAWQLTVHFRSAWHQMKADVPRDAFICYPADVGLMISYYDLPFNAECVERLPTAVCPLVVMEPRVEARSGGPVAALSGLSLRDWASAGRIALPRTPPPPTKWLENMAYSLYSLHPLHGTGADMAGPVVAVLQTTSASAADSVIDRLTLRGQFSGRWFVLNPSHRIVEPSRVAFVLASDASPLSNQEMVDLERSADGAVRFFRVCLAGGGG